MDTKNLHRLCNDSKTGESRARLFCSSMNVRKDGTVERMSTYTVYT